MKGFRKIEYGVGNTPVTQSKRLAKRTGLQGRLFFKREDENPTGSYKDRSMVYWINEILKREADTDIRFVISSSGNAAIAAAACCIVAQKPLTIYISNKIEKKKLKRLYDLIEGELKVGKWLFKSLAVNLQNYAFDEIKDQLKILKQREIDELYKHLKSSIKVVLCDKPKKEAIKASQRRNIIYLRGSTDDLATIGYEEIAYELTKKIKEGVTDIFLPVSSGTGAVGIYHGFKKLLRNKKIKVLPKFYICQTEECHTLVESKKLKVKGKEEMSIVPAICDRIGYRREEVEKIIVETKGAGLILSNQEIRKALYLLNLKGQRIGVEGGLAFAGIIKAKETGLNLGDNIVCLVTGK